MRQHSMRWAVPVLLASLALPATADLLDALKQLGPRDTSRQPTPEETAGVANAPVVPPPNGYESEMSPDRNCSRPRDKFDVADKISSYGGMAASLRLQRLVTTNFQYSDLKPEDRKMLRYIAQTSVWVPPEVEIKLGDIYTKSQGFFKREEPLGELEAQAFDALQKRLERVRATVPEYPSEITLKVDHSLKDGAFSRFGGLIQLSDRFLNGLGDAGVGADFLLAHEMSHVYKRHAIKDVQFMLISSAEGWNLAKQVLRGVPGVGNRSSDMFDNLKDTVTGLATIPALIDFVKSVQISFGKDQESEADACSVVWLKALGDEPGEAWREYQKILGANSSYDEQHPSTADRRRNFEQRAERDTVKSARSIDKGTVQKDGAKIIAKPSMRAASGLR